MCAEATKVLASPISAVYHIWYVGQEQQTIIEGATVGRRVQEGSCNLLPNRSRRRTGSRLAEGSHQHEKRAIGEDIKTVELGWPIGMPVTKPLGDGLHEVRTQLGSNRIARVVFYVDKQQRMVLLHGFVKKTKKMPNEELELARKNKAKHQKGLK
jgi:phage-related protein